MPEQEREQEYKYEAFISYRHLPKDSYAAKRIQRSIENFRVPSALRKEAGRTKFLKCFRDEDELPLAESLGDSIEAALELSKWLIIVCTPDYIGSNWCRIEREEFIKLGRRDRIIPVLVSGSPETSFPPEIMERETPEGIVRKEPLAANCTSETKKEFDQKFAVEQYRILAKLLGVGFDDLRRRAQRRQTLTILTASAAAVALLTAGLIYTVYQNNRVKEQRDIAVKNEQEMLVQRDLARKNELEMLVEKSERKTEDGSMNVGLNLALSAYEQNLEYGTDYDGEVKAAMEYATYPDAFAKIGELNDGGRTHVASHLSPDGKYIAVSEGYQEYAVYETTYGEPVLKGKLPGRGFDYAFSEDSRYVYFSCSGEGYLYSLPDGNLLKETVLDVPDPEGWSSPWQYRTMKNAGDLVFELQPAAEWEKSALSGLSAVSGESGLRAEAIDGMEGVAVTRTDTGEELWRRELNVVNTLYGFEFFNNGKYLLADNGQVTVYEAETGEILFDASERRTYGFGLVGDLLAIPYRDGGVCFYRVPDGTAEIHRDALPGTVSAEEDGNNITVTGDAEDSSVVMETTEQFFYTDFCYDEEWNLVLTLQQDGKEWELRPQQVVYEQKYGMQLNGTYGMVQERFIPYGVWCSRDFKYQVILYPEGYVEVFEPDLQPEPVMTVYESTSTMTCAAFYGDLLALGGYETGVIFVDLTEKAVLGSASTGLMCTKMTFSPEGERLLAFSALDAKAYLVNVTNRRVIKAMDCEGKQASAVGFSTDGRRAVVVFDDGTALSTELYLTGEELAEAARKRLGK